MFAAALQHEEETQLEGETDEKDERAKEEAARTEEAYVQRLIDMRACSNIWRSGRTKSVPGRPRRTAATPARLPIPLPAGAKQPSKGSVYAGGRQSSATVGQLRAGPAGLLLVRGRGA